MDTQFGRVLVTGGTGFLGMHLQSRLTGLCDSAISTVSSHHDLTSQSDVARLFDDWGPFDTVFHLAGRTRGIESTSKNPAQFFYDNAMMGLNVIHASHLHRVNKIIVVGSVCAYPLKTPLPMNESNLWNGRPELSNASYGYAKRLLSAMLEAYWDQYRMKCAYVLLANLYGPGDRFDSTGHVIPMLIQKMHTNSKHLQVRGTGNATRDFLYVEDAADALIQIAQQEMGIYLPINIGSGIEVSIKDIISLLGDLIKWDGIVEYDTSKPDGQPRRMLDLGRARALVPNWNPKIDLATGLSKTIEYFRNM